MKKLLLSVGLLSLALFAYKNFNFVKKLDWKIRDVQVRLGFPKSKLVIDIELVNNTDTVVKLNSIIGVVSVNGELIANVNYATSTIINSGATTLLSVDADVVNVNFLNQLLFYVQKRSAIINFKGTINAQGLIIPIDYDYNFTNG